jgi:hypothetical protein
MILILQLIGGLIAGPFIFLNRLWDEGNIILMIVMIILFPLSILAGIKISLFEWFFSVVK